MTNQTNLDFLFQMTAMPERSANSVASSNSHRGGFDDHLLQASSTSRSRRSETRSNSTDTVGRAQSQSTNNTDERPSQNNSLDETAAADVNDRADDDETINEYFDTNQVPADEPANTAADDANEETGSDTSSSDVSAEVAVAAATAGSEAIRQSQAAAITETRTSLDPTDANAEAAAPDAPKNHDVTQEGRWNGSPKRAATTVSDGVEVTSRADDSNVPTEVVEVGPERVTTNVTDVAAAESGKQASRKDKAKSNALYPDAASATAAASADQITEASGDRPTANAKGTPAGADVASNGLAKSEEKTRSKSDIRSERRDDAAPSNNRAAVPEVVVAPRAQIASATANADTTSDSSRSASKAVGAAGEPLQAALGKSQRGAAKVAQRAAAGQSDDLPRVDAARFVGRVAKAVQVAHERGGSLQLRLSPPELGSLRLELTVQNGVMTASLETENPAARQVLLDHLPALRDRLAEQNIRVERFDVDVRQEQQHGGGDPRASQQHERQHQPPQSNHRHSAVRASASEEIPHETVAVRPHATNTSINVLA